MIALLVRDESFARLSSPVQPLTYICQRYRDAGPNDYESCFQKLEPIARHHVHIRAIALSEFCLQIPLLAPHYPEMQD
jgi:hypothetical protein